jgi:signal transduction histidine kinase
LEQALLNLLANANRYGREGGLIQLELERGQSGAVFRVADDGPGIPTGDRERIFERYYRAETESTRRSQGSGLGLPIVRAIAELHGGQIHVEETPGGGSTFVLDLPLAPRRRNVGA